jgi:ATP-dependent DNA helicase PIF1
MNLNIDYDAIYQKSSLSEQEIKKRNTIINTFFNSDKEEANDDTKKLANHIFIQQKNIFLTGFGGSGKSYQTKLIYKLATIVFQTKNKVQICSTTASSALNLGIPEASTIHSWSGLVVQDRSYRDKDENNELKWCDGEVKQYLKFASQQKIKMTELLIIDEISMMGGFYLKTLDLICKNVRKSTAPFGGIQLLFVGDLLQLPPVKDVYPFVYKIWNYLRLEVYILKKCYRQSDKVWSDILNEIRYAKKISKNAIEKLKSRSISDIDKIPNYSIFLFSKNADASNYNQKCLNKLIDDRLYTSISTDESKLQTTNRVLEEDEWADASAEILSNIDYSVKNRLNKEVSNVLKEVENEFKFKLDSIVMLRKNLHKQAGLVNGARGIIKDITVKNNTVTGILVEFAPKIDEYNSSTYTQVDFTRYNDDQISNPEGRYINTEYFRAISTYQCWFYRYPFENIEYISNSMRIVKSRIQFPFNLAWGISIHKSQGLTLDSVAIDFKGGCFCPGQAYVSLSRAKYLEKLYLLNFNSQYLYSDKVAVEFDKQLQEKDINC